LARRPAPIPPLRWPPDVSRETKQEQNSPPQKRFHPVDFIFTSNPFGPAKSARAQSDDPRSLRGASQSFAKRKA
jgi:hypothetical protein